MTASGPRRWPGSAARRPAAVQLLVSDGEPAGLIEAWSGADLAVVVDAVRAQPAAVPGRLHRLVLDGADSAEPRQVSSHGLGLGDAVGLARALGRMPGRLIVHAVEAADLRLRPGLSPPVAAAADDDSPRPCCATCRPAKARSAARPVRARAGSPGAPPRRDLGDVRTAAELMTARSGRRTGTLHPGRLRGPGQIGPQVRRQRRAMPARILAPPR